MAFFSFFGYTCIQNQHLQESYNIIPLWSFSKPAEKCTPKCTLPEVASFFPFGAPVMMSYPLQEVSEQYFQLTVLQRRQQASNETSEATLKAKYFNQIKFRNCFWRQSFEIISVELPILHLTGLSIQHPSIQLIPKHIPKHKNNSIQIYPKIFEYLEEALDSLISRLGRTLKCLT